MTRISPNWVILGPGAISGLIAGSLLEHGQSVSILPRLTEHNTVNWQVIRSGAKINHSAPVVHLPLPENSIFLVAVKAFDVIDALKQITALDGFQKTMPVLLSHNGMVQLPEALKGLNLRHMVTTHGAVKNRNNNGEICIEHRGVGRSWLEAEKETEQTEFSPWSILQATFPPLVFEQELSEKRWLKLIINCVINPLTAIHQCVNGELLKDKWQEQLYNLVVEAVAVANSQNVSFTRDNCYREVLRVAQETASNHSSMLQDIKQQKRTEIQQLTGYLIKTGESAGIATPTHQALLDEFQKRYAY
ncbi:ketopantoate reductase family protein [Idiomarina aminovorans]|uniref:ketopantoate reductase family protein n=1 Tax=Idiomarina aminovorans TaxID=2914829 RepID=UPI0020040E9E|nr:2-dehydropantoate 2-reductase [Idiomarina sp. ATCH4]